MSEATPSYEAPQLVPVEQLRALQSSKDKATERVRKRAYATGFSEGYNQCYDDLESLLNKGRSLDRILELLAEHCAKLQDWSLRVASREVDYDQSLDPSAAPVDGTDDGGEATEDGN